MTGDWLDESFYESHFRVSLGPDAVGIFALAHSSAGIV